MCHNPPLVAEEESGQHLSDLPRIRAEIAEREKSGRDLVDGYRPMDYHSGNWDSASYFRHNSLEFLNRHQECVIGIVDEYGESYPLKEDPATT
jgi:hypothetical protein